MTHPRRKTPPRGGEAGFTLVEALVAIVVLVFGLMAVTNLMLVAASSNSVANQGTAAVASAIRVMDMIKATTFSHVALAVGGGEFDAGDAGSAQPCSDVDPLTELGQYHCNDDVPGVGRIHTHWQIAGVEPADPRLLYVRVRSEGSGALSGARSRADFTTFRACTNSDSTAGGSCPVVP